MHLHIPPALHRRGFRLLWIGMLISVAGTQMQFWALLWHIRTLTALPIALGAIGLTRIVPIVLFSLIGGSIADVLNRRTIMIFTQLLSISASLMLAYLTWQGNITLWHIYGLSVLQAIAVSFDVPARQAIVPNLVSKEELPNAFSLTSIAFTVGSIAGPALSGLVIAYSSLTAVYVIDAISYLAILGALFAMGSIPQNTVKQTARQAVSIRSIREGIDFILQHPIILSSMILDFIATFFASANALLPIFAVDILHVGEIGYGWLSAAQSVGAATAALILSQVNEYKKQGLYLLLAVVSYGVWTLVFGFSRAYMISFIALAMMGASDTLSMIIRNTIRQLQTPDYIRGRMVSVNQIFFMGGPQLGEIEAGVVAQLFGAPFAVITGGIGTIIAVAWIARKWPSLRNYQGDESVMAGAD